MVEFRRKLYRRGSSWETTIPMPLLFALDLAKKQIVVFRYLPATQQWVVDFVPADRTTATKGKKR